jgi:glutamate 5-kinase
VTADASDTETERQTLRTARRLIVKIGSALLVDEATNGLRAEWMAALAEDISALRKAGTEVIIVSSGAIAVGRVDLGLGRRRLKLEEKQAAAAVGQIRLAHAWQDMLARFGIACAQVLLTPGDTEERRRHLNARNTIEALLRLGAVPVINENDTVATDEIRFGDNDRLAARVAQMVSADTLVLLSDIDGLYTADPRHDADAAFVPVVHEITIEIEAMAGGVNPGYSSGGMVTKIAAAKIAMRAGCRVAIADGKALHSLVAVGAEGRCTWFAPRAEPGTARKSWIAGSLTPAGAVIVDEGAVKALADGRSLLPAGVVTVEGLFERGDTVAILTRDGRRVGCGLIAYSTVDAKLIAGHKSSEIEALLGYRGRDEMIHRDDLVLDG